jgi:hypothetical protein
MIRKETQYATAATGQYHHYYAIRHTITNSSSPKATIEPNDPGIVYCLIEPHYGGAQIYSFHS